MPKIHRRDLLKSLGIGAAAAALGPSLLWPGGVRAQSTRPLRILFFYDVTGYCRWRLLRNADGGVPLASESTWRFPEAFEPLEPWKSRTNAILGIDLACNRTDPTRPGDDHANSRTASLTGAWRSGAYTAGAISINRFLATELARRGQVTALQSIELSIVHDVAHRELSGGTFGAGGSQVAFVGNPVDAWDRLFSRYVAPETPTTDDRPQRRAAAIEALATAQTQALVTDLEGRANRATAERYYDELVALFERRRVTTSPGTTRVDVPTRAEVADAWASAGRDPGRVWRTNAEWMGKLAAAALHADVTRVATIRMLQPDRSLYGFTGDWHEDIQHPASQAFPPNGTLLGRATAFEALKVGALVGLLRELESRREPDGTTLLDNTVVVVCGEIGDGWHRDHDMPWFVIGDAHGYFRTGRAITYPRYGLTSAKARDTSREIRRATDGASVGSYRYNSISRSNNDLFVTLAQAMGMSDVRSFGLGAVNYGAMTELRGG